MSAAHLVPDEALVLTAQGPISGSGLQRGSELLVVDRGGAIGSAPVTSIRTDEPDVPVRRLLNRGGEALVPSNAELAGPRGMVRASELVDGAEQRVEFVAPSDLPAVAHALCPPLAGISPGRFLVPRENGTGDAVCGLIEDGFERLDVRFEVVQSDRWLAITLEDQPQPDDSWTWSDEFALLQALCAWEVDEDDLITSRVRMDQPALRRRLIGAFIAAGPSFAASWLPGYLPVECWVTVNQRPLPAYDQILRVGDELAPSRFVETASEGSLIIGSTIVRCAWS